MTYVYKMFKLSKLFYMITKIDQGKKIYDQNILCENKILSIK